MKILLVEDDRRTAEVIAINKIYSPKSPLYQI